MLYVRQVALNLAKECALENRRPSQRIPSHLGTVPNDYTSGGLNSSFDRSGRGPLGTARRNNQDVIRPHCDILGFAVLDLREIYRNLSSIGRSRDKPDYPGILWRRSLPVAFRAS